MLCRFRFPDDLFWFFKDLVGGVNSGHDRIRLFVFGRGYRRCVADGDTARVNICGTRG
jgi:hypothetical protein